jgi:TrmH family RNA methyltransferase
MSTLVTSRNNPLIKTIRLISAQKRNAPRALVLAEGVRVIREALNSGLILDAILVGERFGHHPEEEALVSQSLGCGIELIRLSEALLRSLSAVSTPQGALALVRLPAIELWSSPLAENPLLLCACGIQDPGNLGTLIRTAWAAGASMVLTTRDTVSARNPKSIRASAGACFHLPIVEHLESSQVREYCRLHNVHLCRTVPRGGRIYTQMNFRSATAILLGNEARGICQSEWENIPAVSIPMAQSAESLNVASAGAILLFEILAQRSQLPRGRQGKE